MKSITIYTKPTCGYCHMAKELLRAKKLAFSEIDASDPAVQKQMAERALGRWSVPQIFIGDAHIGGCDDLHALERGGKLDSMIAG